MVFENFMNLEIDIIYAVLLSVILGFILGLEREMTNKSAGLRTHMLVCIGSCVFTLLSIYAFPLAVSADNPVGYGDPARIAAQVLTGIGFIGGGTVLRHGTTVSGLTTAATLWISAAIGMACGTESFALATLVAILTVSVLVLIRIFEKEFIRKDMLLIKNVKVVLLCKDDVIDELYAELSDKFNDIQELSRKKSSIEGYSKVTLKTIIKDKSPIGSITRTLNSFQNVDIMTIQEVYD